MSHAPVTIVASGGAPVVDATPLSGTALNNPTSYGIPLTPTTGARTITIVVSGAPPVVFIDVDGVTYMPGGSASSLTAPVLAMDPLWTTADSTPDFTIDIDDSIGAGDDVQLQIQAAGGDWSVLVHDSTHTITAPEDAANEISLSNGALSNGDYEARARVNDGVSNSNWSNTQSFTIDAAPTLSSATGSATGSTTASLGVTTNQSGGTLYWVVTTSSTSPSAAQVKAGNDHTGAAAADSGSQAVASSGAQSVSGGATGLSAGTTYYGHFMHEDAGTNQSTVSTSSSFTTTASYSAVAVRFTRSEDDVLSRGGALTGVTASKVGILSFWMNLKGNNGAAQWVLGMQTAGGANRFFVRRRDTNVIEVAGRNSSGTNILTLLSDSTYTSSSGWKHVLASWDLASGVGQLYVNDASDLAGSPTLTNDDVDFGSTTTCFVGDLNAAQNEGLYADIADLYFNIAAGLDLSNSANRRKFISSLGKPVDLGSDGSTPTGTAPILFLSGGSAADWHTNDGAGGGLSVLSGALSAGASSPSD